MQSDQYFYTGGFISEPGCWPLPLFANTPRDAELGRYVAVSATPKPGAACEFYRWGAPGTMIDFSDQQLDVLTHAGQATIAPWGRHEETLYLVGLNNISVTVEALFGGQIQTGRNGNSVWIRGLRSTLLRINPTYNGSNYQIVGWQYNDGHGRTGTTYRREVVVRLSWDYFLQPIVRSRPGDIVLHSISSSGGGRVFATGSGTSIWPRPMFLGGPATNNEDFSRKIWAVPTPDGPGHQFRRVQGQGIESATPGCITFKYWNSGISATVEFCEKSTIHFQVQNTSDAGNAVCAGYCTASPAKKYYQAPYWEVTAPTTWAYRNADWVALTAHPRPGYTFVRWKGEGVAWLDNQPNFSPPPPAYPLDAPDEEVLAVDESGNLVPHVNRPTIYIRTAQKDANGEGGPAHRHLTAVFRDVYPQEVTILDAMTLQPLDGLTVLRDSDDLVFRMDLDAPIPSLCALQVRPRVGSDLVGEWIEGAGSVGGYPVEFDANDVLASNRRSVYVRVTNAELKALGVLPQERQDAEVESFFGDQDTSGNALDSLAFDAFCPAPIDRVPAMGIGNWTASEIIDGQGRVVLPRTGAHTQDNHALAQYGGGMKIWAGAGAGRDVAMLQNQADWVYISGHGSHATGTAAYLSAATVDWGDGNSPPGRGDVTYAIIAACSVLDWHRLEEEGCNCYPGEAWAQTGPQYLLGYFDTAPSDEFGDGTLTAECVMDFFSRTGSGTAAPVAWMEANIAKIDTYDRFKNACAIEKPVDGPRHYYYIYYDTERQIYVWRMENR